MANDKSNRHGFTVVELMVSLLIGATVLTATYELFVHLRNVGVRQTEAAERLFLASQTLAKISEDLMHSVSRNVDSETVFSGENCPAEVTEFTLLRFYCLCSPGGSSALYEQCQLCRTEYKLKKENGFINLYKFTAPAGKGNNLQEPDNSLICPDVEDIKLAFFNGHQLTDRFLSKDRLPVYVEIQIMAGGKSLATAVQLPCGRPLEQYDENGN